mgnify:CR=1 FL=1
MTSYEMAKEKYAAWGVDTEKAMEQLKKVPVSLHCWQLDDVMGFDNDGALTGGIQTTGNYPGRAKTPEQLMADMEEAMKIIDGKAEVEVSGNVTKENIARLTDLGVDYISSGALTHSAPILDISLKNLHVV